MNFSPTLNLSPLFFNNISELLEKQTKCIHKSKFFIIGFNSHQTTLGNSYKSSDMVILNVLVILDEKQISQE